MRRRFNLRLLLILLGSALATPSVMAAGPRTHAEIGRIAWEVYMAHDDAIMPGLAALRDDQDMRAFYSGCTFPDFGYDGINDDAAEYSHWLPYHEAYCEYLRETCPPPWDAAAERRVAFFLGMVSHGIADIPWHFDNGDETSMLTAALEAEGASHGDAEVVTDIFVHALSRLEPRLKGHYWWAEEDAYAVFQRKNIPCTRDELVRGCRNQEGYWARGAMFGPMVYPFYRTKFPWTRAHYDGHPYGGMQHGAALTAMHIRMYFARLNGQRCLQNIPVTAGSHAGAPILVFSRPKGAGGEEIEVKPEEPAALDINLEGISAMGEVKHAALWLCLSCRQERGGEVVVRSSANAVLDTCDLSESKDSGPWVSWDVTEALTESVNGPGKTCRISLQQAEGSGAIRFVGPDAEHDENGKPAISYRPILSVR